MVVRCCASERWWVAAPAYAGLPTTVATHHRTVAQQPTQQRCWAAQAAAGPVPGTCETIAGPCLSKKIYYVEEPQIFELRTIRYTKREQISDLN